MKTTKNLVAITTGLVVCLVLFWFSTTIQGGQVTYDIRPEISIPEYKTDATRAIDAYERMIDRYMDLNERNFTSLDRKVQHIIVKLDTIDARLTKLSSRMTRLEKAIGIKQPQKPVKKDTEAEELAPLPGTN